MRRILRLSQKGDTIIEVLIAITVVSSVLAITYNIMNRNFLISRSSQERTEATKVAQGQMELLKSRIDLGSTFSGNFCLSDTPPLVRSAFTAGAPSLTLPDNFTLYDPGCVNVNGSFYNVSIVPSSNQYIIRIRWNNVRGVGQDEVSMVLRI